MDLSNIKISQESQSMTLMHPVEGTELVDDSGKAFTIDLMSSDTNIYKSEFSKLMKLARTLKDQTPRDADEKACGILSKITTGCHLIMNGKKFKFTEVAMAELYLNPEYSWIKEQVEAFIRNRGNFIKS